jgi:hypothetical protein
MLSLYLILPDGNHGTSRGTEYITFITVSRVNSVQALVQLYKLLLKAFLVNTLTPSDEGEHKVLIAKFQDKKM